MNSLYCNQCQAYVDTNQGEFANCPMCQSVLAEPLPVAEVVRSQPQSAGIPVATDMANDSPVPLAPAQTSGMVMPAAPTLRNRRRHGWTILPVAILGLIGNFLVAGPFLVSLDPASFMDQKLDDGKAALMVLTTAALLLSVLGTIASLISYVVAVSIEERTGTRSIFAWIEEVGILLLYSILNMFLLHILISAAIIAMGPSRIAVGTGFFASLCVMLLLVRRFFLLARK